MPRKPPYKSVIRFRACRIERGHDDVGAACAEGAGRMLSLGGGELVEFALHDSAGELAVSVVGRIRDVIAILGGKP